MDNLEFEELIMAQQEREQEAEATESLLSYTCFYHDITKDEMKNGEDLGTVLWFSGCEHACEECQNPQTWNPNSGIPFDGLAESELIESLQKDYIHRLTLSGGDPMHPKNRDTAARLAKKTKELGVSVWLYTGYRLNVKNGECFFVNKKGESFQFSGLECIDVIVDGPFNCHQRKLDIENGVDPAWRGDSTQRVIDIPKTLASGEIIRFCE